MPFAEDLADLADSNVLEKVVDSRPLTSSVGEAARNERSMITSKVGTASGGINTANMSRNTGGTGLGGPFNDPGIQSPVAGLGQNLRAEPAAPASSGKASRSREEIELVFDKNKGAIFALYNRALRMDPSLEGKAGSASDYRTVRRGDILRDRVSSELGDEELERKLVQRDQDVPIRSERCRSHYNHQTHRLSSRLKIAI